MRLAAAVVFTFAAAASARAEIAVLGNGQTLKVTSRRQEGDVVWVGLKGGGEVGLPPEMIRGFVPDEIVDEIAAGEGDVRVLARAAAERYGLDPGLVLAVVAVESNFEARAVSKKGAQGLMQLMPGTADDLGVADALDPATNLDGGARYLQALLRLYKGDLRKALAAYNAGPGAVARHGGVPPYRETQDYVRKVMKQYAQKPPAAEPTR
jgi:transglycosylase-like protein with SLT domain